MARSAGVCCSWLRSLSQAILLAAMAACFGTAAEWQWSVPVDSISGAGPKDPPRAFLWIPPDCAQVRGVVVGQNNMLEGGIFEHHEFRRTLSELGFAEVWVTPIFDPVFDFSQGAGERFDAMMDALAGESGYTELRHAPVVPIGHSACASYPWNFAAWNPGRTLAILSIKGDAPLTHLTGSGRPNPAWGDRTIDGIPGLLVMGEYEWMAGRVVPASVFRAHHPATPIAVLCDAGRGHFDSSDQLVRYLALFLRKAAGHRLPPDAPTDGPIPLKPVDPREGWLVDSGRAEGPRAPAAPFGRYAGDAREAFWAFDEEMARATEAYRANASGQSPQLLGYIQDGEMVSQKPNTHAQVTLRLPPMDENLTFNVSGGFLDRVPPGNPEKWAGLPAGAPIAHSPDSSRIALSRITGPVVQIAPETFAIRFTRTGCVGRRPAADVWLLASHPGDRQFRSAVQQAVLPFPWRNTEGTAQRLTFPEIPDQPAGVTHVKFAATSDAGVPVFYYVREGPAELEGDTLRITDLPPRAKFPVKVTVVAWQWGRTTEPKLKSAEPIERAFFIRKPAP